MYDSEVLNDNFLDISGLKRIKYKYMWHPNEDFLKNLELCGIQAYILEGTIYGCFANRLLDSKIETQWFGHHISAAKNNEGKIVPNSTIDLYQVLELCKPEVVEGLLFNLDVLSEKF